MWTYAILKVNHKHFLEIDKSSILCHPMLHIQSYEFRVFIISKMKRDMFMAMNQEKNQRMHLNQVLYIL